MRNAAKLGVAAVAAAGGALALASVPVPLIEIALASSGISELVPAAAPPLGGTARALVSALGALLGGGAALALLPSGAAWTQDREGRDTMGSAVEKIVAFVRRGKEPAEPVAPVADVPLLRRADAHPDAPARAPIMASRDLGEAPLAGVDAPEPAFPAPQPPPAAAWLEPAAPEPVMPESAMPLAEAPSAPAGLAMPRAPEPLPWEVIKAEMARIAAAMQSPPADAAATVAPAASPATENAPPPSIGDLTARLERGLARRQLIAPGRAFVATQETPPAPEAPAAPQAAPVIAPEPAELPQPQRARADEEALAAALATLRGITAKAG